MRADSIASRILPLWLGYQITGIFGQSCGTITTSDVSKDCSTIDDYEASGTSTVTAINLENVDTITKDFMALAPNVKSITGNSLKAVQGIFNITSNALITLSLPNFSELGGILELDLDQSPITSVTFNWTKLPDDVETRFVGCPNLQRITMSSTAGNTNGTLHIWSLDALNALMIDGMLFGEVLINGVSITSLPNVWPDTMSSLTLYALPVLKQASIPSKEISGDVDFAGVGAPLVEFPNLVTIDGDFNLIQGDTATLSLPNLETISGSFTSNLNDKLTTVSIPKLKVCPNIAFSDNSVLESFNFPALESVDTLTIIDNEYLNTIDLESWLPKLGQVTSYITLVGQITNITFPPLQDGVGIKAPKIVVNSSVAIDCKAFEAEITAKDAIIDISNFFCTSGPSGSKPSYTASIPSGAPTATGGSSNSTNGPGSSDNGNGNGGKKSNTGPIAGGVVGGVVVLVVVILGVWYFRRRSANRPLSSSTAQGVDKGSNHYGGAEGDVGGIEDGHATGGIAHTNDLDAKT